MRPQVDRHTVAIIGAGVIGCAVAWALAREGQSVLLIDRDAPGRAGASFGNVGHIATELVEPLPSPRLLFGFWRLLFAFGGPLHIPLTRVPDFAPWACRFAAAAFRLQRHTRALAPLVRGAADAYERALNELGRRELLSRNGHFEVWFGPKRDARAAAAAVHMERLGIATSRVRSEELAALEARSGAPAAALWFPGGAHVADPYLICTAFAEAAVQHGAAVWRTEVSALSATEHGIEMHTSEGTLSVRRAVVCAGAWSASLLKPFGVHAPLEAARGYHVELPGQPPVMDAAVVYVDSKIVVTPLAGRLRASGYMEFTGLNAPPDPRKPARLRRTLETLGYQCDADGPSWVGPRPVLPDYLPGIGRAPGPHELYYAIGHQHIGLTLAPGTGALIADLIAGREPSTDVAAFDLRRFGST